LVDDLERSDGPQLLVIDDLHLAGPAGAEALELLLQYRGLALQLVVASRVDPQVRLHRMRANEELVEVRDEELSFSAEEAGLFFSGWGVCLSQPELALVHQSSEGWIAGLQMTAISNARVRR
jgi:LuxR family transcriptional regulator, maltose regulon positive regulatory protein